MKILVLAILIVALILTVLIADACRITPRIYHNGNTALVLSVYNVPVLVFVQNDPRAFVIARQQRTTSSTRSPYTVRWIQAQ